MDSPRTDRAKSKRIELRHNLRGFYPARVSSTSQDLFERFENVAICDAEMSRALESTIVLRRNDRRGYRGSESLSKHRQTTVLSRLKLSNLDASAKVKSAEIHGESVKSGQVRAELARWADVSRRNALIAQVIATLPSCASARNARVASFYLLSFQSICLREGNRESRWKRRNCRRRIWVRPLVSHLPVSHLCTCDERVIGT